MADMRESTLTLAIVVFAVLCLSTVARGDESKASLDDVPKTGMQAAKAMFPKAEIVGAAKETEAGKTVYEVTFKDQGRTIDVIIGTSGDIQLVEREIAEKELPSAVSRSLAARYPQAAIKFVERVDSMKDGKLSLDFFEVLLSTAQREKMEVQIQSDGKIKAEEKKQPGDE